MVSLRILDMSQLLGFAYKLRSNVVFENSVLSDPDGRVNSTQ